MFLKTLSAFTRPEAIQRLHDQGSKAVTEDITGACAFLRSTSRITITICGWDILGITHLAQRIQIIPSRLDLVACALVDLWDSNVIPSLEADDPREMHIEDILSLHSSRIRLTLMADIMRLRFHERILFSGGTTQVLAGGRKLIYDLNGAEIFRYLESEGFTVENAWKGMREMYRAIDLDRRRGILNILEIIRRYQS